MRNRYIYHHFINGKEVSKEEFINQLNMVCVRCDTDYDNPLLNISYTDTELVKKKYDFFKCHPNNTTIYVDYNISFNIRRELKTSK